MYERRQQAHDSVVHPAKKAANEACTVSVHNELMKAELHQFLLVVLPKCSKTTASLADRSMEGKAADTLKAANVLLHDGLLLEQKC